MNKTTFCIFVLAICQLNAKYYHTHDKFNEDCEDSHGEAEPKCCPSKKKEVCGKSGLTYFNKCFL